MQFPRYEAHDDPEQSPVDTYISYVAAEVEAGIAYDNRTSDARRRLLTASSYIGKACLELTEDERQGDEELRTAQDHARPATRWKLDGLRSQARLLMSTAEIIRSHNQAERLMLMRATQHMQVIDELAMAREKLDHDAILHTDYRRAHGQVAEFTALALLTRLMHPRALALPALPHQDFVQGSGQSGRGFDILFVETASASRNDEMPQEPVIHKLQVKSNCLGYCQDEMHDFGRETASTYATDTVLISACCDLDETNEYGQPLTTPMTDLVLAEARGELDDAEVRLLDDCSNRLLLTVTGDERRRGTFRPQADKTGQIAVSM